MQATFVIILGVTITSAFAQLQIGQYANDNKDCANTYENRALIDCNPKPDSSAICAVLSNTNYVYGVNFCFFCVTHGNSSALVVDIGKNQSECSPFKVGSFANNDPYCKYLYNRSGPKVCTREGNPICALLNGKVITGGNKCDFCSTYGYSNATITSIGKRCT